jgi:hypothetical protein
MPVELEITELNDYQKAQEYINSTDNYVTLNIIKNRVGISSKIAHRVLRLHPNTMLSKPIEFGSNKFRNEKLYKKVSNDEILYRCKEELNMMKKNKVINDNNIDSYINSGFVQYMMKKYRISLDYSIIDQLK